MHVVEIFLPLTRRDGSEQPRDIFAALRRELVDRFGGLTAFTRAPAEGLWDDGDGVERDRIVIFEVIAAELDRAWWSALKARLERDLGQDELLIRASAAERL